MRMNGKNDFESVDVYSDLDTPYSSVATIQDGQEFSLQQVQEKLGEFPTVEEPVAAGVASADVMPSQQTLTMSYQRDYQSNSSVAKKVNTKTMVASICYVAAVLALVLGITFASVAVSGVFSETLTLTSNYEEVVTQVGLLEEELSVVDYEDLAQRAAALGYINADDSNTQTYTRVETRPAQNFAIETNWFDSLCDWLSGVFGG